MSAHLRVLYQLVAPMEMTVGEGEMERRRAVLQRYANPDVSVEVRSVRRGTASIESAYDEAQVTPYLLESLKQASDEGFDALIVGCFSDPAIDAAREIISVPVVGPGVSAIHLAQQLGHRFSIISPNDSSGGRMAANMRRIGVSSSYASSRGMGLSVLELARGDNSALDRISAVGKRCVSEDGAEVLILGCMSMAFLELTGELEARIGVPVVSPVIAALKTVEMMLAHRISHSRAGWPSPPLKPILARE